MLVLKNNSENLNTLYRCGLYRKRILEISQLVSALHIAPAFSCIEIVDLIYNEFLYNSKKSKLYQGFFVMSKGHGCMAQYVTLEDLKILNTKDLNQYCTPNGFLGAHPDRGNPGIEASTGSLGHGMGMAVGMAYAEKIKKTNNKIYLLLSDGELQEGSTWESAMMAANLNLDNLIVFVDNNDFGGMDRMSNYHKALYPLKEKFDSFGWDCSSADGHNEFQMKSLLKNRKKDKPYVMICKTIKGKGVSFMENVPIWHYRSPNQNELKIALQEIKEKYLEK